MGDKRIAATKIKRGLPAGAARRVRDRVRKSPRAMANLA
jgi:hypothetical protein